MDRDVHRVRGVESGPVIEYVTVPTSVSTVVGNTCKSVRDSNYSKGPSCGP